MLCNDEKRGTNRMPRSTKKLTIPNNGGDLKMNKKQDQVEIHVSQTCQWCYNDPDNVFPKFLPMGQVSPGTYGPYIPQNDGTVTYGCPLNPPCTPGVEKMKTGHTITVTG